MIAKKKSVDVMPLSIIIDELRKDLAGAVEKRDANWKPMFELKEATVEIAVSFERDLSVEGGIAAYVVTAKTSGSEKSASLHKITVRLVPTGDVTAPNRYFGTDRK